MQRLHRDERLVRHRHRDPDADDHAESAPAWPGKHTLTESLRPRPGALAGLRIDRQAAADAPGAFDAALLDAALAGPGQPLPGPLRAALERALDADLSAVRIRSDGAAAEAAATLGAHAFAIGHDIVFGAGRYRPDDADGLRLLAHEVAHTVQQAGAAPRPHGPLEVSRPGDAGEVEADRFAATFVEAGRGGAPATPSLSPARSPGATIQGEWERGQNLPTQDARNRVDQPADTPRAERRPFQVFHFPKRADSDSSQRILLIGGIHGDERAGIEVVDILIDRLQALPAGPPHDIYVVPILSVSNAERGARRYGGPGSRDDRDPNRDFPQDGASRHGGGRHAPTRALLQLIEQIAPTRVVQVHGTSHRGEAGFSRDQQQVPDRVARYHRAHTSDAARTEADLATMRRGAADGTTEDTELTLAMAQAMRDRCQGDSVHGNDNDEAEWTGGPTSTSTHNSLGHWGAAAVADRRHQRPPMSVITVETAGDAASVDRPETQAEADRQPDRSFEEPADDRAQTAADRRDELMTTADVIEAFILGTRPRTGSPAPCPPAAAPAP